MKKLFLFLIFTVFLNTNLFAVSYSSSCNNSVCEWKVSFDGISIDSKMCSQYYEKSSEDLTELESAKQFICYMQDFKGVNYNAFDDFQLYKLESLVLEIFVDDILTESENESIDAYKKFAVSSDRFVSYVNQRESKKINEEKDAKNISEGVGFSTQSQVDDSQDAIDREIAELEAELEAELAGEAPYQNELDIYLNNIAAHINPFWVHNAKDNWTADVYLFLWKDGGIRNIDVRKTNISNIGISKPFEQSIIRAIYKSSPFPSTKDSLTTSELALKFLVKNSRLEITSLDKQIRVPDGAKLDSNQLRGWECKDSHYRNIDSSGCIKVPSNGKKMGTSNFKCNSNLRKLNNRCVSKLQSQKQNSNNSNKSNNDPTLSEMIEACKYIGSQITKLGFGFSNNDIEPSSMFGLVSCGFHNNRHIMIKSVEPPRVSIGEQFDRGGTCVDFKTLKYWQVESGYDCR